jgi:nicotinic acid phosphoribosyltransferase
MTTMTRRTRQHAELRRLCAEGQLARAVDLAFEHFADCGPDDEILTALADALDRRQVTAAVRARFAELADVVGRRVDTTS